MNKEKLEKNLTGIIIISPILLFIIVIVLAIKWYNASSPVEEIKPLEQVEKDNVRLDTEIKILDSIKNEKIIEVKNLDDDSTLILFYKLIGK